MDKKLKKKIESLNQRIGRLDRVGPRDRPRRRDHVSRGGHDLECAVEHPAGHVDVADLDLDMIQEVRRVWQFFRDRRPEAYGALVSP